MITFELNEEERMLKKTAEDFAKVLRDGMRKWEEKGLSSDIVEEYRKVGFGFVDIPSEMGGHEAGFFKKAIVLEELAWGCAGATLRLELPSILLHLIRFSDMEDDEKRKVVDEITEGYLNPIFGIYIDLDGNIKEEKGRFSGKAPSTLGRRFEKFILVRGGELHFFGKESFSKEEKKPLAFDALGITEVVLDGAVPYLSCKLRDGGAYFMSVVRFYLSCIGAGILRASFEYASKYAMEREAFGKKIAHHQGLSFILSDFSIAVSSSELYAWKAAYELDRYFCSSGEGAISSSSSSSSSSSDSSTFPSYFFVSADSYIFVCDMAEEYTVWGVQILGGHGFVKDHPVEKWMREGKALSLLFGGKQNAQLDSEAFLPTPEK